MIFRKIRRGVGGGGRQMFKILEKKWENIEFQILGVVKN